MTNQKKTRTSHTILRVAVSLGLLYVTIAWMTFQWRHPTANQMNFFRHLPSILAFDTLEEAK